MDQSPLFSISGQPSSSRRLPPPCWSNDETVALIESYRDKWYSLCRGNLRANHWQEVADGVAARCPVSSGQTPKTSIQCRHKMEKLRKRYRSEIQRIGNPNPNYRGHRNPSAWVHFNLMDSMELGLSVNDRVVDRVNQEEDDDNDDENENGNGDGFCLYPNGIKQAIALPVNRRYQGSGSIGFGAGSGNGVLIKFSNPGAVTGRETNNKRSFDDLPPPISGRYRSRNGYMKVENDGINGGGGGGDGDVMNEMVAAIERLGDGFVKMERMKMDMARELESMRMKAEMKRTEMILETQQKMWETLSETVLERRKKKKVKGMVAPES
ncbi:uncharacterized protein LOC143585074 [Bidens hawaiensis]|uniref:uncharacterized protein LOC143585074 n=1 Tax=Bidens hawaiensis TaxID=980011 RepID=UPI0040493688